MDRGRCMLIGRPTYKYPIATVPPPQEVAPLFRAIRQCDARPFRIISYEVESGEVFNCSFFDDAAHMQAWLTWLAENALNEGSEYHGCMRGAVADTDALPTAS